MRAASRLAAVGIAAWTACAPLACGPLLGIDDGLLEEDASTLSVVDGTDGGAPDAARAGEHDAGDAGTTTNAGDDASLDDASLGDAGPPLAPDAACITDPAWCNGRCDTTTDNCGQPIDCGTCEAGVSCFSNVCGCMPESTAAACAGAQCGQAINNCNLAVNCGVSGSASCPPNDVCLADAGTCCTPDNGTACGGRCQVQVANNCGVTIGCPSCPGGQVCVGGQCCTPVGCSADCVDSCGQPSQACCAPEAGAPMKDSGGGPCTAMGAACTGNAQCCTGACGSGGTCLSGCGIANVSCSVTASCCYGLTCKPFIMPLGTSATASGEPQVVTSGRCQ